MAYNALTKAQIGKIFLDMRRLANCTQAEIAERLGTTAQSISRWEKGETQPDLNSFFHLCDIYNCNISSMFGFLESVNALCDTTSEDSRLVDISIWFSEMNERGKQQAYDAVQNTHSNSDNLEVPPLAKPQKDAV